jgi:hypothetical protein
VLAQLCIVCHVIHDWELSDTVIIVTAANAGNTAAGTKHTCRTCLTGPYKDKWIAAEYAQLDKHHYYGMGGATVARRDVPPDAKIIRTIWNYIQRGSGEHKARNCMDGKQRVYVGGSKLATPMQSAWSNTAYGCLSH